jgi:hypothetical protein
LNIDRNKLGVRHFSRLLRSGLPYSQQFGNSALLSLERKNRKLWEANFIGVVLKEIKTLIVLQPPSVTELLATPVLAKADLIKATDPRVYPSSVMEPLNNLFPKTPFVLTNRGGEVAHKVRVEMLFKLKGKNVSFENIETLPVGESAETLPTIEGESLSTKHDIFHWLIADWNGESSGFTEDWPKPINIRWQDFSGKEFTAAATLVFHPIKYMLKSNNNWPGTAAKSYVTLEFKDLKFT